MGDSMEPLRAIAWESAEDEVREPRSVLARILTKARAWLEDSTRVGPHA
ncbi:MAG: hypothetical protein M5U28_43395 [Sandaracinaceae bacterium]|nr:hypothetical protein [Sandaracinaceae bacterium]